MFRLAFTIFFLVALNNSSSASQCRPILAHPGVPYKEISGNYGITPSSFVIPSVNGDVIHGIDVSKYQDDVDFAELKKCDGLFVYVRLSAGSVPNNELKYRDHWANTRSFELLPGAYHNLTVSHGDRLANALSSKEELARFDADVVASAHKQSMLFRTRLIEVLALDKIDTAQPDRLGQKYLPVALDLTWQPKVALAASDQMIISEVYRHAICTWINDFRGDVHFADQPVILFAKAKVFSDYSFDKLECLRSSDKFWIQFHGFSGGTPWQTGGKMLDAVTKMCGSADNSRCVMQQYTSFGSFALFDRKSPLDLDRFIGTREQILSTLQHAKRIGGE